MIYHLLFSFALACEKNVDCFQGLCNNQDQCICFRGYGLADCSMDLKNCYIKDGVTDPCGEHGKCIDSKCVCETDWIGVGCNIEVVEDGGWSVTSPKGWGVFGGIFIALTMLFIIYCFCCRPSKKNRYATRNTSQRRASQIFSGFGPSQSQYSRHSRGSNSRQSFNRSSSRLSGTIEQPLNVRSQIVSGQPVANCPSQVIGRPVSSPSVFAAQGSAVEPVMGTPVVQGVVVSQYTGDRNENNRPPSSNSYNF